MRHKEISQNNKSGIRQFVEAIATAILVTAFLITFVIQAFKIPSGSMLPTLMTGDHLFVNKFIYGLKLPILRKTILPVTDPKRGDVIVFIYPQDRSKDFIKRVIGVGGDTLEIRKKTLWLNGQVYADGHGVYNDSVIYPAEAHPRDNMGPVIVPEGCVFVMGDNRDYSLDSRFWGFVDLNDVLGKAFILYWSWNAEEHTVRWSRIATLIR